MNDTMKPAGLDCGRAYQGEPRITPEELKALITVMREGGCLDMASGDTRIILSPVAVAPRPLVSDGPPPPMDPERRTHEQIADEEDEDLFAAVG